MNDPPEDRSVPGKLGPKMKDWDQLGTQQRRRETQKAFDELKRTADVRNVQPEKLAGGILRR